MLDPQSIPQNTFDGLDLDGLSTFGTVRRGKVRDIVDFGDVLVLVSTDRVSAFDQILGTIPLKGQILNQLCAWWFQQIRAQVETHFIAAPDPNISLVRKCDPLPVEVVVRDRLSGSTSTSLWTQYQAGRRTIYGIRFPDGMHKNQTLAHPIITPTTKATAGEHDLPISEAEIVANNIVVSELWDEVRTVALALFETGKKIALAAGLILIDTKYEFGVDQDGQLMVIDEVHTPDSSRYWRMSTMGSRLGAGLDPEHLDKEIIRQSYRARGSGHNTPPMLDPRLAIQTAQSYAEVYEMLTGSTLMAAKQPTQERVEAYIYGGHARKHIADWHQNQNLVSHDTISHVTKGEIDD